MSDDETLIALACVGAAGIAWYWWQQQSSSATDQQPVEVSQGVDISAQVNAVDAVTSELTYGLTDLGISLGIDSMSGLWTPPATAAPYLDTITRTENKYSLPTNMLARLLYQESRYRPEIINGSVKSPAGALGIAQFMPATARQFGINPLDPYQAIDAAGKYLAQLYKQFGNWADALAAYNWGPGNVKKKGSAAAPVETQNYFGQILADLGIGGTTA